MDGALRQGWLCPQPHCGAQGPPTAILVSQISTQRKVNIYSILQEIIQQEGELEEQCVQRLVAIASKEMREILEVVGLRAPTVPCPPPTQGLGHWEAWPALPKALVQSPHGARIG